MIGPPWNVPSHSLQLQSLRTLFRTKICQEIPRRGSRRYTSRGNQRPFVHKGFFLVSQLFFRQKLLGNDLTGYTNRWLVKGMNLYCRHGEGNAWFIVSDGSGNTKDTACLSIQAVVYSNTQLPKLALESSSVAGPFNGQLGGYCPNHYDKSLEEDFE